jgi:hypothetical protein
MNTAAKVAKLRKMAEDKSLPQDVRNTYLDEAVKLEEKAAKGAGVKMAKGGAVGRVVKPMPMPTMSAAQAKKPKGKPMMGGAVVAKAPTKDLPMRGQRTATNMAKGGAAMKKGKK